MKKLPTENQRNKRIADIHPKANLGEADRWTDRQTDGQTDRWADGPMV